MMSSASAMKTKAINQRIHSLLKPLGFKRKGTSNLWNRRNVGFIDIIDIQVSQFSSTYTINIGVVDIAVFQIFKSTDISEFIYQPEATIGDRIGNLIDHYDMWWAINDPDSADETIEKIQDFVLPFFERHQTHASIKEWLIGNDAEKNSYPPLAMNLAILEKMLGNDLRSKEILSEKREKTSSEPWRLAIEQLADRLDIEL